MTIEITINAVSKKTSILVESLRIDDYINNQADECRFQTKSSYRPNIGEEVIVTADGVRIFGGVIVRIENALDRIIPVYNIQCKDWTHYLDRVLVAEKYTLTTVGAIIADIITNYAPTFTTVNVDGAFPVDSLTFDRVTVTEALQRLAQITGYFWYVDYNKDVHFFPKTNEPAPFNLSTTGDKHIWSSLKITEDLSQIRNRIFVIGGEGEGTSRTESYVAPDTTITDQLQYPLANKFSTTPTVAVNSVSKTVGVENVDDEASFDCFWSSAQKFLRFKTATRPPTDAKVDITGIPLFPIIVNVASNISISQYGEFEHKIKDESITTRDQAIDRAQAELRAFGDALEEGAFTTYQSGLRSGQLIAIVANGVDNQFLIQSVSMHMRTPEDGEWSVRVATAKTLGIIDVLQQLLRDKTVSDETTDTLLTLLSLTDNGTGSDAITFPISITSAPYKYGSATGEGRYNYSTYG